MLSSCIRRLPTLARALSALPVADRVAVEPVMEKNDICRVLKDQFPDLASLGVADRVIMEKEDISKVLEGQFPGLASLGVADRVFDSIGGHARDFYGLCANLPQGDVTMEMVDDSLAALISRRGMEMTSKLFAAATPPPTAQPALVAPRAVKSPAETLKFLQDTAEAKSKLSYGQLGVLGFLAGGYIALGGMLATIVTGSCPGMLPGLQKMLFAGVFPVGLMLVSFTGAELVTGNFCGMAIGKMGNKTSYKDVIKSWTMGSITNFAGSVFVAYFLAHLTGLMAAPTVKSMIVGIAEKKVGLSFSNAFLRAVGCNWLVNLAVWLSSAANDVTGKIMGIIFPISAFVAIGFEHYVANFFFITQGILSGANVTWSQMFINNLFPVLLGNIVGGALMVGGLQHYAYGKSAAATAPALPELNPSLIFTSSYSVLDLLASDPSANSGDGCGRVPLNDMSAALDLDLVSTCVIVDKLKDMGIVWNFGDDVIGFANPVYKNAFKSVVAQDACVETALTESRLKLLQH